MKKTTLKDVAELARVSTATVSLILNDAEGNGPFSEETRRAVLDAARMLNYTPNLFAKGLRNRRTYTLGLILSDISSIFYAELAKSIEVQANRNGYYVIFCSSDESPEKERREIQLLKERRVDGLIISSTQQNAEEILQLKQEDYPFVLIDRYYPQIKTDYVVSDSRGGAFDAVEHLIQQGHTRIGCIISSPHLKTVQLRLAGYKAALRKHDIIVRNAFIKAAPVPDPKHDIETALKELLYPPNSVTAVFTVAYPLTLNALTALKRMNLRIPYDLSMVSFDDGDVCNFMSISAIRQPISAMGARAVDLLLQQIENPADKKNHPIVLPNELIVRT